MDFQNLMQKANSGNITTEESKELLVKFNEQMVKLKEKEPQKYLELLKQLNGILVDTTKDLKEIIK